jgi:hypothetical protein
MTNILNNNDFEKRILELRKIIKKKKFRWDYNIF